MLWFGAELQKELCKFILFKNILCYGSACAVCISPTDIF